MATGTGATSGRTPWGLDDVREILGGTTDPKIVSALDRKGLTPVMYSVLQSAVTSDRLAPLLGLLEPSQEGEDRVSQILDLLGQLVENQVRLEAKVDSIIQALEVPAVA